MIVTWLDYLISDCIVLLRLSFESCFAAAAAVACTNYSDRSEYD